MNLILFNCLFADEDSPFELHEMVVPAALKEPWSDVDNLVCLNSYFIRFKPKPCDRQYKDFGLFVKSPLPCEAEGMKIDLHLAHGRSVLTGLVPSGVAEFSNEEVFYLSFIFLSIFCFLMGKKCGRLEI